MPKQYPYHIAIILDGNRRYAKKQSMPVWKGHEFGAKKVKELIKWCIELGIKQLTLYTFSIENFSRKKQEVEYLMGLFRKYFSEMKSNEKKDTKEVKVRFAGRLSLFPDDIQKIMNEISDKTKDNKKLTVNFAIGYGGRTEILDAIKRIISDEKSGILDASTLTEKSISKYLYLEDEPHIIIRPGGEVRVSNFLIYQGAYSEWFFIKKLWPEMTKLDFIRILDEFNLRERRFGK